MSVIQVEDLVSYQLRTNYLDTISDGVGERLITINDAFLNTAGFKAAGWRTNPANIKRTHSPPIPTNIASEYFQAPLRSAGLASNGLEDETEEGGMATGGVAGDTVGPGIATKRRRRREQMEEEDSSDLSDDSDEEGDQRAAQQIKFSKMPIRNRSGSSPLRSSNLRQSSTMSSPTLTSGQQTRRGSQPALEAVKERARRDTVTSSEISSENEFDASAFQRQREATRNAARASRALHKQTSEPRIGLQRQASDLLEEEEEDSDGSEMDSDFPGSIDSASILDGVTGPTNASPTTQIVGTMPRGLQRSVTKKSKPAPPVLQALPPPRPISTVQPKSLLTAAINARRTKSAMPFESFASLSGQGESDPLNLRIWAPFAKSTTKPFEVRIRRIVHENEAVDRQPTVADLIGLSLWRYAEEKLEPAIPLEKLNVNWWTLRMVEDDEVDYDFPALERVKAVTSFTTANNRAARARSNSTPFDEFALVEATEAQFQQNQSLTPQFKQEGGGTTESDDDLRPKPASMPVATPLTGSLLTQNPLLTTMTALRQNMPLAGMPFTGPPLAQSVSRGGIQKLLRIHIYSADAAPGQMITLDVTTDTYLADVLDVICKKRQLDKANHVLKLTGSGTVVLLDRTVESIGNRTELDLYRRRFATDGPLTMSGSPSSNSPKIGVISERSDPRKAKKAQMMGTHPLARETGKADEVGSANYRKYTVWRKQPMRFVGMNERVLAIDGEYLHIMPSSSGKTMFEGQGKTTTVHFSNVVGCKVTRRHPTNFKVVIYRATETKRYDFEAKSADEAAEIVFEIKKGISPYHSV